MLYKSDYLDEFEFKDNKKIIAKVDSFLFSGKEKIHLVLDFDRTMTKSQNQAGENINTWQILKTHLPEEAKEEYQKFYNKYRPLEAANKMKESDAAAWWEEILNLYQKNKLNWLDIVNDVNSKMPIRNGTKELFDVCKKKNIPIIIISAGIKDVIEIWCQRFEIKPATILSTNLFFDNNGYIKGWDRGSLIHVLNKKEKGHKEVSEMKKLRPNIILIGDSINDYSMVNGTKKVLRIIIDDPRPDDMLSKKNNSDGFSKFDLVIKNKSLYPIIKILKLF
ncbi:MAG: hypothetical protein A3G45_00070 [Candidatus Staskawiczbacteria bacterium RIFCSPLOWO2_12_FULL_37_15]|uniref:5'-nucleotidase n=1 Tax=Candidatus Staskawiczbacteria bacterium RIFCSPLOWO2_12_FULL_37_15 TaxID=1802218 RepID=A0A1G2IMJ2_9BACT|nr:MAG: hypothetical protein US35_C0023G0008 [Parcubacteria group bacterium GW2011_GWA2_37_10]OGZ75883.1 MAG: hypothetical protein A3G45_00070 [Candidatus Staskawiczbacteria bacterium RIFCSPLOWO2_12_FULL_37_15]